MSSLSIIAKKLFSPAIRAQIEAGYLNSELKLTELGQLTLLQEFYFNGGQELLTARAESKIKEEKEAAKKD